MNIRKTDLILWAPRVIFLIFALLFLQRYAHYLAAIVSYPYDWEPTDGDHLNFARRIAQGLPIYLNMSEGGVLSIYTPLYHMLVAAIGGTTSTMELGRQVSLLAWVAVPVAVFLAHRKQWGAFLATIAAAFTWLPAQPSMLIDMVQVNQNTLMACLFALAIIAAEKASTAERESPLRWAVAGALACLCFLAKQQGIVAATSIGVFALLRGASVKSIAAIIAGFFLVFLPVTAYLEWVNHGQFLRVTLLDLSGIMISDRALGRKRFVDFLCSFNPAFLATVAVGFWLLRKAPRQASIWQVSILIHIPLLIKTLGNGGGGDNYFATLWISLCVASVGLIARLRKAEPQAQRMTAEVLLLALMINAGVGSVVARKDLEHYGQPTPEMAAASKRYYAEVKQLISTHPAAHILVYRNAGAMVYAGADIEDEGATMFGYAWNFPGKFPRDRILANIEERKYDLISTGVSPFPSEVKAAIASHYHSVVSAQTNILFSTMGQLDVLAPNEIEAQTVGRKQ